MGAQREVTTWYLEMKESAGLRPSRIPAWPHRIERVSRPSAAFARYLYVGVGADWHWTDRLPWSKAQWDAFLLRPALQLYTLQTGGAPVGYFELEQQPAGDVQVTYLGLLPEAMGLGFGGRLVTRAVELAWEVPNAQRVWLHTCTLDATAALPNYLARGFSVYDTKTRALPLAEGATAQGDAAFLQQRKPVE